MNKINKKPKIKNEEDWKKILSPEEYYILRQKGTEPPFYYEKYFKINHSLKLCCKACGNVIFESKNAFDSGSGWPSFDRAITGAVRELQDNSLGMNRIEVVCAKCSSHLGHVFNDGPTNTRKRYCINSISLKPEETQVKK